jgi:hypothetical protein
MDNILLGAIVFMGLLALLSASFFGSQYALVSTYNDTSFSNATSPNITVIGGASGVGFNPLPVCKFSGNVVTDFISLGVCIADGLGWFIGFLTTTSDIPYLQALFIGIGAVVLYRILRILKPTGGS